MIYFVAIAGLIISGLMLLAFVIEPISREIDAIIKNIKK